MVIVDVKGTVIVDYLAVFVSSSIVIDEGSHEVSVIVAAAREFGDQELELGVSPFGLLIALKLSEFNFYVLENSFRTLLFRLVFIGDPF